MNFSTGILLFLSLIQTGRTEVGCYACSYIKSTCSVPSYPRAKCLVDGDIQFSLHKSKFNCTHYDRSRIWTLEGHIYAQPPGETVYCRHGCMKLKATVTETVEDFIGRKIVTKHTLYARDCMLVPLGEMCELDENVNKYYQRFGLTPFAGEYGVTDTDDDDDDIVTETKGSACFCTGQFCNGTAIPAMSYSVLFGLMYLVLMM